ncbi:hypothetical protein G7Y79_00004g012910 [Physcia stellaris]|nr:hypothetical protein G7Y79_00004g012910 [Physcia stellaris]
MTSLDLVPRAGQMILKFGISSSGDDARTVDIPFGTLATEGGSIAIPKALNLAVQSSSGIPISSSDVVCQAFKDDGGTQPLGKFFTISVTSTLGPEPVTIGSIFCSDAKGVKARLGGSDASAQTTSAGSDVATTANAQSIQAQSSQIQTQSAVTSATSTSSQTKSVTRTRAAISSSTSEPQETTSSPSAIDSSGYGMMSETTKQTSAITMDTTMQSGAAATGSSAARRPTPTSISSVTSASITPSSAAAGSSSSAAAQRTSAANSVHTHGVWTVKRMVNVSIVAACYIAWFAI